MGDRAARPAAARSCSSGRATSTSRTRSRCCRTSSCTGPPPSEYPATTGKELFDLFVFDGYLPAELPRKPILAFAPPQTQRPRRTSTARSTNSAWASCRSDDPLLRGVDLTRLHIAKTQQIDLPDWARPVIPGSDGPLLYAGLRDGLPTAVFAFDLRQSDLPLQVAWPIMVSNLAGELLGAVVRRRSTRCRLRHRSTSRSRPTRRACA